MFRNSFMISAIAIVGSLALGGCAAGVSDQVPESSTDSAGVLGVDEGASAKIRHDGKLANTVTEGMADGVKLQHNAALGADLDAKRVAAPKLGSNSLEIVPSAPAAMGADIDMKLNPGSASAGRESTVDMKLQPGSTTVAGEAAVDMKLNQASALTGTQAQVDEVGKVIVQTGDGDFKMKSQENRPSRPEIEEGIDGFK